MSGKKKYIEMFGSFMEPFNYKPKCAGSHAICPTPVHGTAQLQPIHALHLWRPAHLASSSCGAMNIHDVRDRQTSNNIIA